MSDEKKIVWSGKTTSYEHKHNPPRPLDPRTPNGFRQVWMLDAQWTTCPVEVEDEVRKLWREAELGNDTFMLKTSLKELADEFETDTTAIRQYVKEQNPALKDDEQFLIHWWW